MNEALEKFKDLLRADIRQLAARAGVYISKMCDRDRDVVLSLALDAAALNYEKYIPGNMTLLYFWDICLRDALLSRPVWPLRRTGTWEYDYTNRLLRVIRPVEMQPRD